MKKFLLLLVLTFFIVSCSSRKEVLLDNGEIHSVFDEDKYHEITDEVLVVTYTNNYGKFAYIKSIWMDKKPKSHHITTKKLINGDTVDQTTFYTYHKGTFIKK